MPQSQNKLSKSQVEGQWIVEFCDDDGYDGWDYGLSLKMAVARAAAQGPLRQAELAATEG